MAKSTRPIIRIHDLETNEIIDREMNDQEFEAWQADQEVQAIEQAEAEAKATAKSDLLSKLGITAEEARLLLS
ncbi:hypothetical protein UFOVP432_10 [uncultured Caudovirales phage]|uniref:Uncharacterized protein n=1 Tax=uncultured Caudovirales phage TaxID=2100421 RepID=A0A6J5MIT1_9CAUD|nr:hypothetical protein UFOVP432_10 [uncultured Caudovirales phage]